MSKTVSFRPSDEIILLLEKKAKKQKRKLAYIVNEIVTNALNPTKK